MRVTLETFWYWVQERHSVYLRRLTNRPPWSTDPVFQKFRFTNVFRELDRGTAYLWQKILSHHTLASAHLLNIVAYRMFNSIETWEQAIGNLIDWDEQRRGVVERLKQLPRPIYHGAYIIKGPLEASIDTIDCMWSRRDWILECDTVRGMSNRLEAFPGVGRFTAHQLAQDLRFGPLRNAIDGKTWSTTGPGSHRCLLWLGMQPTLESMQAIAEAQPGWDWMPRLEVKDVQQCLCEVQKYVKLKRMLEGGKACKARLFASHERNLKICERNFHVSRGFSSDASSIASDGCECNQGSDGGNAGC